MDKKIDKVKDAKKKSRLDTKVAGRGGPHKDKKEKRQHKKTTLDYLTELEEDEELKDNNGTYEKY
jgi:hypothetical protein